MSGAGVPPMRGFGVLLAKELREIVRTSRLYVVPGLFLFFGLSSPILTKLMPEIIKSLGGGITIIIPPPVAKDAFLQLLKNLSQIGLLAIILTNMGIVAEEKSSGTALLILTKPASRPAFVLAKYAAQAGLVVAATLVAYVVSLIYTLILFPDVAVAASVQATALFAVDALFILAATVGASALARTALGAGGIAIVVFFLSSLLAGLGGVLAKWSPGAVLHYANGILEGSATIAQAAPAVGAALVVGAALLAVGIGAFRRQEL